MPEIKVDVPQKKVDGASFIPLMQGVCDLMVAQAARSQETGQAVTCKKGCSSCCHQAVPISIPEAVFLTQYLLSLPPDRRKKIEHRLQKIQEECFSEGLIEAFFTSQTDEDVNNVVKQYFDRNIWCPFIENDLCTIYSIRPFACREFNAITPHERCIDPFQNSVQKLDIIPRLTTVMARFAALFLNESTLMMPHIIIGEHVINERHWWKTAPGPELFNVLLGCLTNNQNVYQSVNG